MHSVRNDDDYDGDGHTKTCITGLNYHNGHCEACGYLLPNEPVIVVYCLR